MKNLLLVLALVSFFSCKKEIIEPVEDINEVECSLHYKSLVCKVVQFESNNPSFELVYNDFISINFTRSYKGVYFINSLSEFNKGKTVFFVSDNYDTKTNFNYISSSKIRIETRDLNGNLQDNMLVNTPIEIRVYD